MAKFEYITRYFSTPACEGMEKELNELGRQGWELVSVCPTNSSDYGLCGVTAFLKREL